MVRVIFDYTPDDPDPDDTTGMSSEEFETLHDQLSALGADNIEIKQVGPEAPDGVRVAPEAHQGGNKA